MENVIDKWYKRVSGRVIWAGEHESLYLIAIHVKPRGEDEQHSRLHASTQVDTDWGMSLKFAHFKLSVYNTL